MKNTEPMDALASPLLPQQVGEQTTDSYVELGSALRRIMAEDEQFAGNMRDRVGISKVLLGYTDAVMRRRAVEIIHHLDRALNTASAAVLPQVGEISDINNIVANELRRIADEAPINGNNLARMRVLMAADQFLAGTPASLGEAKAVAPELIYMVSFVGLHGRSERGIWRESTEEAFYTFSEQHRRIFYAAPVAQAMPVVAEKIPETTREKALNTILWFYRRAEPIYGKLKFADEAIELLKEEKP